MTAKNKIVDRINTHLKQIAAELPALSEVGVTRLQVNRLTLALLDMGQQLLDVVTFEAVVQTAFAPNVVAEYQAKRKPGRLKNEIPAKRGPGRPRKVQS